jgi:hypothetical protein
MNLSLYGDRRKFLADDNAPIGSTGSNINEIGIIDAFQYNPCSHH